MSHDNKNQSLENVSLGAIFYIIGKIISKGSEFLLNAILTRVLETSTYGVFAYSKNIFSAILDVIKSGSEKSLLKFLPGERDHKDYFDSIISVSFVSTFLSSVIVSLLILLNVGLINEVTLNSEEFVLALKVFSLLLVFEGIIYTSSAVFRSLEKIRLQVAINQILKPIFTMFAVLIAVIIGSFVHILYSILILNFIIALVSVILIYNYIDFSLASGVSKLSWSFLDNFKTFYLKIAIKDIGSFLYSRLDLLMIGFFLTSSDVGIYNIAFLLAGSLSLPLSGFNQLLVPKISKLHFENHVKHLEFLSSNIIRIIFTLTFIGSVSLFIYGQELLGLFGTKYIEGYWSMAFLIIGQLSNSLGGSAGQILLMRDRENVILMNQWFFGILNVLLNYILIKEIGFLGAAVSTSIILVLLNSIRIIELSYLENLMVLSSKILKPIIAGFFGALPMLISLRLSEGLESLLIGLPFGIIVYFGLLLKIGFEEEKNLILELI